MVANTIFLNFVYVTNKYNDLNVAFIVFSDDMVKFYVNLNLDYHIFIFKK